MGKTKIIIFACFLGMFFGLAGTARADYYSQGTLVSKNLLSNAEVTDITGFRVAGTVPANTTLSVSFSQDRVNFYSSAGTKGEWDSCSNGETNIDLSGLDWSEGSLFYKLKLETTDPAATPIATEAELTYDGEAVPPESNAHYTEGFLVSTDLLSAGTAGTMTGAEYFGYAISSLPYGTHVYAQFSTDQANWYNSSGTKWGWDTLSQGDHLSPQTAVSLLALNWKGQTSFYYKLKFTTTTDNKTTPTLKQAGLLDFAVELGGSADTSADPVAHWKFNEGYGSTAHNDGSGGAALDGTLGTGSSAPSWSNDGKFGKALNFDGNDYISVPDFSY